jgi:hypothetical protein
MRCSHAPSIVSDSCRRLETELTIKALARGFRVAEVPTNLARRPEGSASKIRVVADGLRIGATIVDLARQERPRLFFGALGALLVTAAFAIGAAAPSSTRRR